MYSFTFCFNKKKHFHRKASSLRLFISVVAFANKFSCTTKLLFVFAKINSLGGNLTKTVRKCQIKRSDNERGTAPGIPNHFLCTYWQAPITEERSHAGDTSTRGKYLCWDLTQQFVSRSEWIKKRTTKRAGCVWQRDPWKCTLSDQNHSIRWDFTKEVVSNRKLHTDQPALTYKIYLESSRSSVTSGVAVLAA